MWVRRDASEVEVIVRRNHRRRFSPFGPFLLALFLTVFVILVSPRPTFSWRPAMLTFGTAFVLLYLSRATTGRYWPLSVGRYNPSLPTPRRMICPVCRTAQFDTPSHLCACGGSLELLEYWRWTDKENLPPLVT